MTEEYRIVNQCLRELGQSELQVVTKLRLEIQLIQIKRLLLSDYFVMGLGGTLYREMLDKLLEEISAVCNNTPGAPSASTCLVHARQVLSLLECSGGGEEAAVASTVAKA